MTASIAKPEAPIPGVMSSAILTLDYCSEKRELDDVYYWHDLVLCVNDKINDGVDN